MQSGQMGRILYEGNEAQDSADSFDEELARVDKDHTDKLLSEDLIIEQRQVRPDDGVESHRSNQQEKPQDTSINGAFGSVSILKPVCSCRFTFNFFLR